ncbi:hypothetical protein [Pradoshia eiseniae]|nr:hypothetical protein [Pradoshia eiseniae]
MMKSLLLYITLLVLTACLISCQKDDEESFKSIYLNKGIDKIVIKDKNINFREITDIERINKWTANVDELRFIRDENQEERDFLLIYDGCSVKAFHQNEEIGDFKLSKFNGVYYKRNAEFDKQVELLCK